MSEKLESETPVATATVCSMSCTYPERIEETWRADAGWKRADEAEFKLEELRGAVRNLRDVSGWYHSKIAYERLLALLPERQGHRRGVTDASKCLQLTTERHE